MTRTLLLVLLLTPGVSAAQSIEAGAQHLARAAGMPLNDGTIPPGMLTVRIVEGAFTRDIPSVQVEVTVDGGTVQRAVSGADGRAQFAHLPFGGQVHAIAIVADERLESETFQMPAQSGVRLLFVTGTGSTAGSGLPDTPAPPPVAPTAILPTTPTPPPVADSGTTGVAVIRAVLATATVSAFGFLVMTRRRTGSSRV